VLLNASVDDPVMSTMWPLYGPQAGGTLVTVTGIELTNSSAPAIIFVSSSLDQFITLSTVEYRTSKRYISGSFFRRDVAVLQFSFTYWTIRFYKSLYHA